MVQDDKFYMKLALEEARKAYELDEVPIGCIIVKDDKVIARAYNRKSLDNIATYHAEILAIEDVCRRLNTWYLDDCILYVSLFSLAVSFFFNFLFFVFLWRFYRD